MGPGVSFRDGHEIGKFAHGQPLVLGNDLCLNERHGGVAAAEAQGADLQEAEEQL